ncbi:MAG: hypothetical protein IJC04_08915 [Oscillospiraceae bacterium]|nr:hypothetical protein [Oscillospiraceae bacterium]
MNLKLSYRDKVIFIVVMVILVLVAGFFLFIKPKFEDVEKAKNILAQKEQEKAEIDETINTLPNIIDTLKATAKEIGELQEIFLDEGHPYVNETYIREILNELNVEVVGMTTEYTVADELSKYVVKPAHILAYDHKIDSDLYNELPQEVYDKYNGVKAQGYPDAVIGVTVMKVKFNSDLELQDAYAVIDRLAEDEKTVILNSIGTEDISQTTDEPVYEMEATITMYSVFPLNVDKVLEETAEVKPLEETAPAAE